MESCVHSVSNFSSPQNPNAPHSSSVQQSSNRDHVNPIYQTSTSQIHLTTKQSEANENSIQANASGYHTKRHPVALESSKTIVFWDPEAGRFVSSSSRSSSSSKVPGTELLYTGQSIFFGGPVMNEQHYRGKQSSNLAAAGLNRGSAVSHFRQGRAQRGGQLPVFAPSDPHQTSYLLNFLDTTGTDLAPLRW
ncbi:hypothetical protein SLA2020_458330 [Shorea laevis]